METVFFIALWAVGIVAVVILLSTMFGMPLKDPSKARSETHTGTIERLYLRVNGAAINGYPCMDLRCDDGKKRRLELRRWEIYDDLWPGDTVRVVHRLWRADSVTVITRGREYETQHVPRTAAAVFNKYYVQSRTKTRHLRWAEFTLDTGETMTLRIMTDWTPPGKGTAGTITWHGNRLDSFESDPATEKEA